MDDRSFLPIGRYSYVCILYAVGVMCCVLSIVENVCMLDNKDGTAATATAAHFNGRHRELQLSGTYYEADQRDAGSVGRRSRPRFNPGQPHRTIPHN